MQWVSLGNTSTFLTFYRDSPSKNENNSSPSYCFKPMHFFLLLNTKYIFNNVDSQTILAHINKHILLTP